MDNGMRAVDRFARPWRRGVYNHRGGVGDAKLDLNRYGLLGAAGWQYHTATQCAAAGGQ